MTRPLGHFSRAYVGVTPRLQTLTYPNGQTANYSYFDNSKDRRLETLQNSATGGVTLSAFIYSPDVEGQISTWTKQLGNNRALQLTGTYGYDLADQLTSATTATVVPPVNYSYGYDLGGNRTSDQVPPGTHTFNDVNETQDPGYTYDANGNLTADGINTYFWDAANRLVAIQKTITTPSQIGRLVISPPPTPGPISTVPPTTLPPPSTPAPVSTTVTRSEFSYDGLGRRARIVNKQGTGTPVTVWTTLSDNQYLWSGNTLAEERDSTGSSVTKRFFAEGEQVDGANYYYSRDHLGSIREMTDLTGAVRAQYEYDPYGVRTKLSGDLDADFGFTGHWHHLPSGLNLSLYRAYSPTLGRWISRDPIGEVGGINLYEYTDDDPINNRDVLGLRSTIPDLVPPILDSVPQAIGLGLAGALGIAGGLAINVAVYDYATRVEADVAQAQALATRQQIERHKRERNKSQCESPKPQRCIYDCEWSGRREFPAFLGNCPSIRSNFIPGLGYEQCILRQGPIP
jgi:RHS repeat-associated protein